jgi:hypothetical protein
MSSNFENLPLPVNRDAQDYSRLVPANSTVEIPVVGEFVYCKFSDGSVRVVINGKSTNMESGDERRSGDGTVFRGVNLINETGVDKYVIFVIGFGGFDRKIIQGEITTVTGVRKADGRFVDDSRVNVQMNINPVYGYNGEQITAGDVVQSTSLFKTGDFAAASFKDMDIYNGQIYLLVNSFKYYPERTAILVFDSKLQEFVITRPTFATENTQYLGVFCNVPGLGDGHAYAKDNDIYYWDMSINGDVLMFSVPHTPSGMVFENGILTVTTPPGVGFTAKARKYRIEGNSAVFVELIDLPSITLADHANYDPINKQWTFSSDTAGNENDPTNNVIVTDENFNIVRTYAFGIGGSTSGGGRNHWVKVGDNFFGWMVEDEDNFYKVAAVDSVLTLRGFASSVACNVELVDPAYDSFATAADLIITKEYGRIKATGELIRAALELYYRQELGADYMDNVYDVTLYQPLTGYVLESIGGRSVTLAAIGVVDDFSAHLPSRLDITIDSNLPFKKGF